MSTTRRVWAHRMAKCTTVEYKKLDGLQGKLVEYMSHGRSTCTTDQNGLCVAERYMILWAGAARDTMMCTHMYARKIV